MYRVMIMCDNEKCDNDAQVDTVGQAPVGWVQVRYGLPGVNKAIAVTTCSWKCLLIYAKDLVRQEISDEGSAT